MVQKVKANKQKKGRKKEDTPPIMTKVLPLITRFLRMSTKLADGKGSHHESMEERWFHPSN